MIRYTLKCDQEHLFDSWFKSSEAFDGLLSAGHLSCPTCGSTEVSKTVMAPRVKTAKGAAAAPPDNVATLSTPNGAVEEAFAKLREAVEANSEYVGPNFADTARRMHHGEIDHRSIHGEANKEEARSLIEDGVPVMPLPFKPKSKTN